MVGTQGSVVIVGGGLAGVEAAYQCLRRGLKVTLKEMRPIKSTEAHKTGDLAELVCSNSFKSLADASASGLLKREMSRLDSLVLSVAHNTRVPAGQALSVDRVRFSAEIRQRLESFPDFTLEIGEVTEIPSEAELLAADAYWVVATGPLTSADLVTSLSQYCPDGDARKLFFYDAIAPVIDGETINYSEGYWANRWDDNDGGDYFNIPLSQEEYLNFVSEVARAEKMPLHKFEETKYFESCLPIEVMIERGVDTLRFGPLKPVGLIDPRTGKRPWAVIQLRQENASGSLMSMVGCQTKMKWPEQKRIFGQLPALRDAEFFRLGSVHRNTYLNSPEILADDLTLRGNRRVYVAGQLSGVEGYTESAAMGLLVGRVCGGRILNENFAYPPVTSMLGSLLNFVRMGLNGDYQPMNANLGLLPGITRRKGQKKADIKMEKCSKAFEALDEWAEQLQH